MPEFKNRIAQMSDAEKAKAFDKLFACERVRILGYARGGPEGNDGHIQHLGMEIWEKYPDYENTCEKDILLDFLTETPPGDKYLKRKPS
jgi:hypothetical protein